jgi:hypothetical protein
MYRALMPDRELLSFDAAVARLISWVGLTVEAWVEFADGPSHVAGMHGELREAANEGIIDASSGRARTFTVGASAWFRLTPCYGDDAQTEHTVQFVTQPSKLMFDWRDGTLHVARSSIGSPS